MPYDVDLRNYMSPWDILQLAIPKHVIGYKKPRCFGIIPCTVRENEQSAPHNNKL